VYRTSKLHTEADKTTQRRRLIADRHRQLSSRSQSSAPQDLPQIECATRLVVLCCEDSIRAPRQRRRGRRRPAFWLESRAGLQIAGQFCCCIQVRFNPRAVDRLNAVGATRNHFGCPLVIAKLKKSCTERNGPFLYLRLSQRHPSHANTKLRGTEACNWDTRRHYWTHS
jgi:hypothetical protein